MAFSNFNFLIHLLPALPGTWKDGSFKGLRTRGGFIVDASWEEGKLETVVIKSMNGNPCRIKYGDELLDLELKKGEVKEISWQKNNPRL
jgi:alpha-L-fucosidase 2